MKRRPSSVWFSCNPYVVTNWVTGMALILTQSSRCTSECSTHPTKRGRRNLGSAMRDFLTGDDPSRDSFSSLESLLLVTPLFALTSVSFSLCNFQIIRSSHFSIIKLHWRPLISILKARNATERSHGPTLPACQRWSSLRQWEIDSRRVTWWPVHFDAPWRDI